ncbi:MAG: energy transducer TonB [Bacillota bacterium]
MKENKLYKYILISLLIHALILFAFPLANRAGLGDENETQDFGFIELVEYKPITQTSQEAGENQNAEEEIEQEKSVEKDQNIDENEENEIEIDEETENTEEETEEIVEEDINTNEQETQESETEPEVTEEIEEETDIASENDNSEVISSEESDIEMEVEEKSDQEESQNDEQVEEEDSESDNENQTENEVESSEEEQEEEEAPPPPPTSGELIARSITPQYPKDLIGENKKGTVEFIVNIDQTGELIDLTMTSSSGIEQIDKTSRLAIERGWEFKSYNMAYSIPIIVDFKINEAGNPVIDVNLGEVDFKEVNN